MIATVKWTVKCKQLHWKALHVQVSFSAIQFFVAFNSKYISHVLMCDLFAPTSLDSLVKHCFYYATVEAIEENIDFFYSFIDQAFNEHLFWPVLEAEDTEMSKTWNLFSGN